MLPISISDHRAGKEKHESFPATVALDTLSSAGQLCSRPLEHLKIMCDLDISRSVAKPQDSKIKFPEVCTAGHRAPRSPRCPAASGVEDVACGSLRKQLSRSRSMSSDLAPANLERLDSEQSGRARYLLRHGRWIQPAPARRRTFAHSILESYRYARRCKDLWTAEDPGRDRSRGVASECGSTTKAGA